MSTCLVDENLPENLTLPSPWSILHVRSLGNRLSDSEIWDYAAKNNLIVLTKDTDFYDRLLLDGPPPKVVWVRLGNCKRRDLQARVVDSWSTIESLLKDFDLVEIHSEQVEGISFKDRI